VTDDHTPSRLSHLDADGRARMVDVAGKPVTKRTATATGTFITTREVIALVRADDLPKADVLATARLAGIQGAKRTSELIPLCHPLPLTNVEVTAEVAGDTVEIRAVAETTAQTGVEMEALTAAAVAALTVYDMTKAIDKELVVERVELVEKTKEPA
jgi:cyclic pyranopterin phosphate synthase